MTTGRVFATSAGSAGDCGTQAQLGQAVGRLDPLAAIRGPALPRVEPWSGPTTRSWTRPRSSSMGSTSSTGGPSFGARAGMTTNDQSDVAPLHPDGASVEQRYVRTVPPRTFLRSDRHARTSGRCRSSCRLGSCGAGCLARSPQPWGLSLRQCCRGAGRPGRLVHQHHWLTDSQFLDAVAVGQIAPGPVVHSRQSSRLLVRLASYPMRSTDSPYAR